MSGAMMYLAPAAMLAVAAVLAMGLRNFLRPGVAARSRSNRLMQWRVVLQLIAVVLIMLVIWIKQSGS